MPDNAIPLLQLAAGLSYLERRLADYERADEDLLAEYSDSLASELFPSSPADWDESPLPPCADPCADPSSFWYDPKSFHTPSWRNDWETRAEYALAEVRRLWLLLERLEALIPVTLTQHPVLRDVKECLRLARTYVWRGDYGGYTEEPLTRDSCTWKPSAREQQTVCCAKQALCQAYEHCGPKLRSLAVQLQVAAEDGLIPLGTTTEPATRNDTGPLQPARHSPDFRSVHWFGTDHAFTATQAVCVRLLWEAWEHQTPDVGDETMLTQAGVADRQQLRHVFRNHPAWGKMIRGGNTKGTHRLAPPAQK